MCLIYTNARYAVCRGLIRYLTYARCAEGQGCGYFLSMRLLDGWSNDVFVLWRTSVFLGEKSIRPVDGVHLDNFID